jgi:hypothetical protein
MEYSTYLTTMAQIAGVLVGFANLANAISRPGIPQADLQLNKIRIMLVTELGLILIGFCVLPLLFSASRITASTVTRALSFIIFLSAIFAVLYNFIRGKRLTGKYFPAKASRLINLSILLVIIIPSLLNATGLFGIENIIFVFCCLIFLTFVFLCILFCRLLYSVLSHTSS